MRITMNKSNCTLTRSFFEGLHVWTHLTGNSLAKIKCKNSFIRLSLCFQFSLSVGVCIPVKIATTCIMGTAHNVKRRKCGRRFSHVPIESTCTLLKKLFLTFLKISNSIIGISNARKQRTKRFLFSLQQLSIWRTKFGESLPNCRNKKTKILLFYDVR